MNNFIRIDPKKMSDKYKIEDEITRIIINEVFNKEIIYIPHYSLKDLKNCIDLRWEKIFSLKKYYNSLSISVSKINNIYIDHDVILNPELIISDQINFTYGLYTPHKSKKISAMIIDFKLLEDYFNLINLNELDILNDINNEEKILCESLYLSRFNLNLKLNNIILKCNQINNKSCFIHYNDFIITYILKYIKNKNIIKKLLNLNKKLKKIYKDHNGTFK